MSEAPDKDSKTEEASEKKIRDTIDKGKLPYSREAPIVASLLAVLVFAVFFSRDSIAELGGFLSIFLERPDEWPLDTAQDVISLYRIVFFEIARILSAIMIPLILAGLASSMLQNAPRFVLERIRPQASRISLAKGWSRLFGVQGMVEFAKSVAKVSLVIVVLTFLVDEASDRLLSGMITNPAVYGLVIRDVAVNILVSVIAVMGVIALADVVWSRYQWRRDLRMTRQEVKDEHKQSEGDPIVRSRMRSLARDRARRRMMTAVPNATLVIANPTHYAIALKYVRDEDAAPYVLAKGQDLVALKIREIAEERGIPVFEEPVLARSMYKQVSVDSSIPSQFYRAVAELVRVVYGMKQPTSRAVR